MQSSPPAGVVSDFPSLKANSARMYRTIVHTNCLMCAMPKLERENEETWEDRRRRRGGLSVVPPQTLHIFSQQLYCPPASMANDRQIQDDGDGLDILTLSTSNHFETQMTNDDWQPGWGLVIALNPRHWRHLLPCFSCTYIHVHMCYGTSKMNLWRNI